LLSRALRTRGVHRFDDARDVERGRETSITLGEVRGFGSRAALRTVAAALAHDNERSNRA
jgi:hypothetical protein